MRRSDVKTPAPRETVTDGPLPFQKARPNFPTFL
jgi:hypothetical protein